MSALETARGPSERPSVGVSGMAGMERLAAARLREPRKRVLKPEGVAVSMDQQPVRDVA